MSSFFSFSLISKDKGQAEVPLPNYVPGYVVYPVCKTEIVFNYFELWKVLGLVLVLRQTVLPWSWPKSLGGLGQHYILSFHCTIVRLSLS